MNEEEIRNIAKETFMENVMTNLDSSLINVYIQNLEKENEQLKQQLGEKEEIIEKAKEYIQHNATSNYFDAEKNMFRVEEYLLDILNGDDK